MIHRGHYSAFRVLVADYNDKLYEPLEFGAFLKGVRNGENGHISFERFALREHFPQLGRCWFYIVRIQHRRSYAVHQLLW